MEFIITFIYGLIIGSFLNVCIYRIPLGISVVFPRSACPSCGKPIKAYDLIPVISFLILRGKCRNCKAVIGWQYPLVELLAGVLTGVLYLKFGLSIIFLKAVILCYLLIIVSFIDLKYKRIPNLITYPGIIIALIGAVFFGKNGFYNAFFGLLVGGGILFPIAYFYPQGMGFGDVKLLALIGAFLGVKLVLYSLFIGSILGTVIGLILIAMKFITRKTTIPFGPFLASGAVITILIFGFGG